MQMPVWSKKGKVITVTCTFVVALALMLISGAPAKAQDTRPVPKANAQPQTKKPPNNPKPLSLWRSYFDVFDTGTLVETSCEGAYCIAFTPIFTEQVICPVQGGESCTFQITIESENYVGSNEQFPDYGESGQYQFSVDGAAPSPGPVGPPYGVCPGCYEWMFSKQWNMVYIGTSYAVTATVKNTKDRQKHSVEVDIGCKEEFDDSNGCLAGVALANLQVAVYTCNWIPF